MSRGRWRQELVNNVEERVQLKRSLIDTEIEGQSQQTAKAGVMLSISRWEEQTTNKEAPSDNEGQQKSIGALQQELSSIEESITANEKWGEHSLEGLNLSLGIATCWPSV